MKHPGQSGEDGLGLVVRQVASQQSAAILDLAQHELLGQPKCLSSVGRHGKLSHAQLDVLAGHTPSDGMEPTAIGKMTHRNIGCGDFSQSLGRNLDVAEQTDLRNVDHLDVP
jgi:hypothetical protein